MNIIKKILVLTVKIFSYGIAFCVVVLIGFVIYIPYSEQSIRTEICDQAIIGQKLEFKVLIEKYIAKGVYFSFNKKNEQSKILSGKKLDAEDVAYLTDMTGRFSFRVSRGYGHRICQIYLKNGIVESKKLTGFD